MPFFAKNVPGQNSKKVCHVTELSAPVLRFISLGSSYLRVVCTSMRGLKWVDFFTVAKLDLRWIKHQGI